MSNKKNFSWKGVLECVQMSIQCAKIEIHMTYHTFVDLEYFIYSCPNLHSFFTTYHTCANDFQSGYE